MNSINKLTDKINESILETFKQVVMIDISVAGKPMFHQLGPTKDSITCMIGLAGVHNGVLAVHFSKLVALDVASKLLLMEFEEINVDVQDAIGAIVNILSENLIPILSDRDKDIQLSLPSIMCGDEYEYTFSQLNVDQVILPFETPVGIFNVEFGLITKNRKSGHKVKSG